MSQCRVVLGTGDARENVGSHPQTLCPCALGGACGGGWCPRARAGSHKCTLVLRRPRAAPTPSDWRQHVLTLPARESEALLAAAPVGSGRAPTAGLGCLQSLQCSFLDCLTASRFCDHVGSPPGSSGSSSCVRILDLATSARPHSICGHGSRGPGGWDVDNGCGRITYPTAMYRSLDSTIPCPVWLQEKNGRVQKDRHMGRLSQHC